MTGQRIAAPSRSPETYSDAVGPRGSTPPSSTSGVKVGGVHSIQFSVDIDTQAAPAGGGSPHDRRVGGRYCHIKCGLATLDGWTPENPYIIAIGFLRTSSATQYGCTIVST